MSEGHGDPPADVRSFLPRPGEPVEQYAERLRALHRDLTLVLEAVERGLAASAHPEEVGPPVPVSTPIEIVPDPTAHAETTAAPAPGSPGRMPRVEVLPPPSGEERRHAREDRRQPPEPAERPQRRRADDPRADGQSEDNGTDPGERRPPRPVPPFPARPSAAHEGAPPREPEWVQRGDGGFTAPTFPPSGPQRLQVSPVIVAAFAAAWLVVVALLVALLVG